MQQGIRHRFPTTQWTAVANAGQQDTQGLLALEQLLVRYQGPLRAHLTLHKQLAAHEADDLLQGFISEKVLQRHLLGRANRQRGRFRTFLLVALDRYVATEFQSRHRKCRLPAGQTQLDDDPVVIDPNPGPSDAFELAWARQVLADAAHRMRDQCLAGNRRDVWQIFEGRVLAPALEGSNPAPYEDLVREFGLSSTAAASNLLITAKRMYARSLRAVVGEYITDDQEVEQEIAELRAILGRSRD